MAGITSAVQSIIDGIVGVITSILQAIFGVFQGIFGVFNTVLQSGFELTKNLTGFLLSNILVIAVVAAAFFGYTAYVNRAGGTKPVLKTQ